MLEAATTRIRKLPHPQPQPMRLNQSALKRETINLQNAALSTKWSPEEEDCVVAVKFLEPQLSFFRPNNSEWIDIRIQNPSFFSSNVMHSKKDDMFLIPGFGGHVIASWDLHEHGNKPKFQRLRFRKTPCCMTTANKTLLDSCCKSEHLVESRATGETFMVKLYKKTMYGTAAKIKTEAVMVFKLDDNGNAVYTQDTGDLYIFITESEPICLLTAS